MKIALIGYGKMGKEIEKIAIARGHEIVSIIDINNHEDFNSEAFKSADVAIEFTNPTVAYDNYMKTFAAGVKLVSGSTGWMDRHGEEVKRLCTEGGKTLFWSSNFSLGVAIFSAVNKYLAKIMNNFPAYDVSMVETHHIHKVDAPSGTAITLAEGILENIDRKDKCRVFILFVMIRRQTVFRLPMMQRIVKDLLWVQFWLPNIRLSTKDF